MINLHFSLALIKKYIDQNGGKSQFALSIVAPGAPINPAFPLVKVAEKDFQLIPVQNPPPDTVDTAVPNNKDAAGDKKNSTPALAPLRPKQGEKEGQTEAAVTSRWKTSSTEAEIIGLEKQRDGKPLKLRHIFVTWLIT